VIHHAQPPPQAVPSTTTTNELKDTDDPVIACVAFEPHKPKQPGLRANVYVSKECTRDLAEHIVEEVWGVEYGMLYKYLDYIFRCQVFDGHVKRITFNHNHNHNHHQNNIREIVVFHSGLQRRSDHEFLYFVLCANDTDKRNAEQKWRVPAGHIRESCVSRSELQRKWRLRDVYVPQRTKFYSSLHELLFDDTYEIEVNWPERLRTNKERIYQELKHNNEHHAHDALMIDKTNLVKELTEQFEAALVKAHKRAQANPRLAVAQGFVETKQYKKRVELLLPLRLEYPKHSGQQRVFALALRKVENERKYMGMSLLTMSMAYANARLVGYVDSSWLTAEVAVQSAPNNKTEKKEKDGKKEHEPMSPSAMHAHHMHAMYGRPTYTTPMAIRMRGSSNGGSGGGGDGMSLSTPYRQVQSLPPMPESRMVAIDEVHMTPQEISYALAAHAHAQAQAQANGPSYSDMHAMAIAANYHHHQQALLLEDRDRSVSELSDERILAQSQSQYSRSAAPIINPPELHHKLDDNDDDDVGVVDDDDDALAFALDIDTEQEIQSQRLRYNVQSAPPNTHTHTHANNQTNKPSSHHMPVPPPAAAQLVSPAAAVSHHHTPSSVAHYRKHSVAKLPERLQKFAQLTTQQFGVVPYAQTNYHHNRGRTPPHRNRTPNNNNNNDSHSLTSSQQSDSSAAKYLIEISRLPGDCGVNMLRHILTANGYELASVHLVEEDKTAVLRFADQASLNSACEFVSRFQWRCKVVIDSPYLRYYDQQKVWQYQVSNKWAAHHADMARLIERIPPRQDLIIEHGARRYFIEKYNRQQGRQTNLRTQNQRMIRRIRIHVWAPKENPIFAKAIPVIATEEQFDSFFYNTRAAPRPPRETNVAASVAAAAGQGNTAARFHLHRSEPPQNQIASEREKRLSAAQKVVPSQLTRVDSKYSVIGDTRQYSAWRALDDDEDEDYQTLMRECGMRADAFSAVWNHLVPPSEALLQFATQAQSSSGEYRLATPLFYIADAFEEQDVAIMEQGFVAAAAAAMDVEQFTFFGKVASAMEAFSGDADGDNNIKIFMCSVYLTPPQQTDLQQNGEVNVEDVSTIQLVACACVNVFVLKKALAIE